MDCVKRAIAAGLLFLGTNERAPNIRYTDEIKSWAEQHGLRFIDQGVIDDFHCAVLVTYKTEAGNFHTVFASDIGPFLGREIHSVVVGWEDLMK